MEQESRGRRQVDLFNFSFLDILACVIGLLIFILTIVVISGGGASSQKKAAAVEESRRAVADARAAAAIAHERRLRLESLLARRAGQALDPASAAEAMHTEARLFEEEARALRQATARVQARLTEAESAQSEVRKSAAAIIPRVIAIDAQAREIDREAAQALADAVKAEKADGEKQNVQFYVPRVRPTDRKSVLAEVAGGRIWFLDSDDYDRTPMEGRSTRLERKASAAGVPVGDFVSGKEPAPSALRAESAGSTVIDIALRPDGFAAFRQLREWAWRQGYAINWSPLSATEPIIVTRTSRVMQQ